MTKVFPFPWLALAGALLWLGLAATASRADSRLWRLASPDKTLTVSVRQADEGGWLSYAVQRGRTPVLADSPLGLTLAGADGDLATYLTFVRSAGRGVRDRYALPAGKVRTVDARGNEKTLTFRNPAGRAVEIVFRAYNDGMAYRYRVFGAGDAAVTGERSGFHVPPGAKGWVAKYNPNYEEFYPEGVVGRDWTGGEQAFPALFDVGGGQFALLAESDVGGRYCGCHLAGGADGTFQIRLADASVSGTLPWATPWRVVITGTLAQVVPSTLVQTLSPPAPAGGADWVRPGRAAWSWWSQDTGDVAQQRRYIDFAHEMGWEYNLIDAGWPDFNNKNPGPAIVDLVNYGRARGVGILLWSFARDLDTSEKRQSSLPLWHSWGVRGIKADFFDSDSQKTMQLREAILQTCWDNHLLVNFHGDQAPRGQDRTWPHFLTREGVRGAEYYKFGPFPTPAYNCTLPFTRNAIGPMDYTPVTFSTPNRKTTAAHELFLAVVYQSGWQHFADSPDGYAKFPLAEQFLRQVPADWDETRFLGGYPAQFACLARRKGDAWFVGLNNAATARTVTIPLAFLGKGAYRLDLYTDGRKVDGGPDDSLVFGQRVVSARDAVTVAIPANGGLAARLVPRRGK